MVKRRLESVGGIERGLTIVGYPFRAGAVTPSNATVSHQWQISKDGGETFTDLEGETSNEYIIKDTLVNSDVIRVATTGTGNFSGDFVGDTVHIRFYY